MTHDTLIGRTMDGDRVYVTARLSHPLSNGRQTVDHKDVTDAPLRLSFFGQVIGKGKRLPHTEGQISDWLGEVVDPAPGLSLVDVARLRWLWDRWHLNDMQSHCAHQDKAIPWDESPPCPVTGYRAGSAWLVEPIPNYVLSSLRATLSKRGVEL